MNETVLIVSMVLLWVVMLFNLLLTLALVRRTSTQPRSQQKEWLKAGEKAPDFTAETLDGKPVTLASYAGRPVAFLFMSPSCDPCREHLPGYDALGKIARRAGTQLVYVSTSGLDETRIHVEEFGITLPVIVTPQREEAMAGSCPPSGAVKCWTSCKFSGSCFGMTFLNPFRKYIFYDPTGPYCSPVEVCSTGCYGWC